MSCLEETPGKTPDMSPLLSLGWPRIDLKSSWKFAGKCPERGKSGCPCTDCCPCHQTHERRGIDGQMNWPLIDDRGAFGLFYAMAVNRSKAEISNQNSSGL